MVDRNDTLIREVDEELRRERFEKLWKQYSPQILLAAGVFVALVGGYKFWEFGRIKAAQSAGASYVEARELLAQNKPDDAAKVLDKLAKTGSTGFSALARLQLASSAAKAGKSAEALAAFETLAKDESADPFLRDFAKLQAAGLRLGEADWTEMQNRLNALAAEKSVWRAGAREMLGLAAMKAGKLDEARTTFQTLLGDRNTPPGIAERVRIAMSRIVESELAKPAAAGPAATDAGKPDSGKADSGKTGAAKPEAAKDAGAARK